MRRTDGRNKQLIDWWDDEDSYGLDQRSIEVIPEEIDLWSGLYDQYGNKLMRLPNPIGFRPR